MPAERDARIVAVVPTIDAGNLERALPWLVALRDAGVTPVVATNSAPTAALPLPEGFVRSSDGTNGGFAHSVNRGARDGGGWNWLVLLNDDLQLTGESVAAMVAAIRRASSERPELLLFDPEPPRTIPSRIETLVGLSLLGEIPSRLHRPDRGGSRSGEGALAPGLFKSFSAVAISRGTWETVGTLSERFLFCYEDADYARRFMRAGGVARAVPLRVEHNKSKSTKSRIRTVLPAIAASATAYLVSSGMPSPVARALTVLALVVRLPMVFAASSPWTAHLGGVVDAIRLTVNGGAASLPAFSGSSRQPSATRNSS